ncbi:MAG: FG-GAP-like repeat-containing protein [Planctomycetota bacterium]
MQPSSVVPAALLALAATHAAASSLCAQSVYQTLPRHGVPASANVVADVGSAVVPLDIDQDGDLDLFVARRQGTSGAAQNRLLRNDGQGRFEDRTAAALPAVLDRSYDAVAGDVDGDGDVDLVTISRFGPGLTVLRNDGTGVFTASTQAGVGEALALGDVDGDGDLDVVVAPDEAVLANDGTGTFTAVPNAMPVRADDSSDVVMGDFDGDGDLDLAFSNRIYPGYYYPYVATPGTTSLYLNNGTGTFVDATAASVPAHGGRNAALVAGDWDGDGDLDLAVVGGDLCGPGYGCGEQIRILRNDGAAGFSTTTLGFARAGDVAAGDIDGDGDLDLVVAAELAYYGGGQNRVLRNDGAGNFADVSQAWSPSTAVWSASCALADLDGDGDLDQVVGNWGGDEVLVHTQHQLHAPAAPRLGQTYALDAYLRRWPSSPLDRAWIWLSTLPAQLQLPSLGTLGIDPNTAAPLPAVAIQASSRSGSSGWPIPNQPSLVGVPLYAQALLLHDPFDLRLSNVVRDVIGP